MRDTLGLSKRERPKRRKTHCGIGGGPAATRSGERRRGNEKSRRRQGGDCALVVHKYLHVKNPGSQLQPDAKSSCLASPLYVHIILQHPLVSHLLSLMLT